MKLKDFIVKLQALADRGYSDAQVYYRHGSSNDCGPLSSPGVTDRVDECGPFDLKKNEIYISIYAGN